MGSAVSRPVFLQDFLARSASRCCCTEPISSRSFLGNGNATSDPELGTFPNSNPNPAPAKPDAAHVLLPTDFTPWSVFALLCLGKFLKSWRGTVGIYSVASLALGKPKERRLTVLSTTQAWNETTRTPARDKASRGGQDETCSSRAGSAPHGPSLADISLPHSHAARSKAGDSILGRLTEMPPFP